MKSILLHSQYSTYLEVYHIYQHGCVRYFDSFQTKYNRKKILKYDTTSGLYRKRKGNSKTLFDEIEDRSDFFPGSYFFLCYFLAKNLTFKKRVVNGHEKRDKRGSMLLTYICCQSYNVREKYLLNKTHFETRIYSSYLQYILSCTFKEKKKVNDYFLSYCTLSGICL